MTATKPCTLTALVLLGLPLGLAQHNRTEIKPDGTTVMTGQLHKIDYTFTIQTSILPASERAAFNPQCTTARVPCSLTNKLTLMLGGKNIFIPKSSYADLGDINSATILTGGTGCTIRIEGGDASEAYSVRLRFAYDRLIERRFYVSEDASHPFEVSRYFPLPPAN